MEERDTNEQRKWGFSILSEGASQERFGFFRELKEVGRWVLSTHILERRRNERVTNREGFLLEF